MSLGRRNENWRGALGEHPAVAPSLLTGRVFFTAQTGHLDQHPAVSGSAYFARQLLGAQSVRHRGALDGERGASERDRIVRPRRRS